MVTANLQIPNPPHSLVRVYGKKTCNGGYSLYLNYTINKKRHQHCLRLYIEPDINERGKVDKLIRLQNLKAMNNAMTRRMEMEEHLLDKMTQEDNLIPKVLLINYLNDFIEESRTFRKGNSYAFILQHLAYHLKRFLGGQINRVTLEDVTPDFCRKFIVYLKTVKKRDNKKLSPTTASQYLCFLKSTLNNALKDDLINCNPFDKLKKHEMIVRADKPRCYLTERELMRLKAKGDPDSVVEKAFFFACYTGLRYSDVSQLSWEDLQIENGNMEMNIVMKKTDKCLKMKLSKKAMAQLPQEIERKGKIFQLPSRTTMMRHIKQWSMSAHINKNVVFHTARHTFGTLLAEKGVAIEVIQKLMGHDSINTTSVYVDVTDKAKDAAVDLL